MSGNPANPKRSVASLLDAVDIAAYGVAGALVLGGAVYEVGATTFASRSLPAISAFLLIAMGTVAAVVADVRRRRFGLASRVLVGAWLACCAVILAIEVMSVVP